ncbi:hypothetical protein JSE7799_00105 [Jannaschia seosinensis]|uniref:Uncharacterized protein n=1 Tax=Jannaschia seosinensis TaxID=313367 RepID=A0A0M7B6J2_9RHOB|nr:hypothetical protein [Jannaschia seosinensis]CUH09545.1 hypothetical protein JSE7799_00105 [Jannaschia seosinensis]
MATPDRETHTATTPSPDARPGNRPVGDVSATSGSARAGVETPTDRKSRKWLWIAAALVVAILLIFWLASAGWMVGDGG